MTLATRVGPRAARPRVATMRPPRPCWRRASFSAAMRAAFCSVMIMSFGVAGGSVLSADQRRAVLHPCPDERDARSALPRAQLWDLAYRSGFGHAVRLDCCAS